jgi:hypothetical protein
MPESKRTTSEDAMGFKAHCVPRDDEPEVALWQSIGGHVCSKGFSVNRKQAGELALMLDEFAKS